MGIRCCIVLGALGVSVSSSFSLKSFSTMRPFAHIPQCIHVIDDQYPGPSAQSQSIMSRVSCIYWPLSKVHYRMCANGLMNLNLL